MASKIVYKKKSAAKQLLKMFNPMWRIYYKVVDFPSKLRHRFYYKRYLVKMEKIKKWRYYDQDEILLHANMQVLKDFVDHEDPFSIVDYDHDEYFKKLGDTIKEIYAWWENYPNREKEIEDFRMSKYKDAKEDDEEDFWEDLNRERTEEEKAHSNKLFEMENQLVKEEQEMLHKLIDIRSHLWT